MDTEAGIKQVDKKLDKAVEEIAHLKRVDKRNNYMKNGGNAFLSQVIMEAKKMNEDWFDELTNGEPLLCTVMQMSIIESLLRISPISETQKELIYRNLEHMSELEAEELIIELRKDCIETDVRKQWEQMFNQNKL